MEQGSNGAGALGPLIITVCILMLMGGIFGRRVSHGPAITADA